LLANELTPKGLLYCPPGFVKIIPTLKQGKIVVSDRYFWSTLAYGEIDLPIETLIRLKENFLYPDKIIFLKVNPKNA